MSERVFEAGPLDVTSVGMLGGPVLEVAVTIGETTHMARLRDEEMVADLMTALAKWMHEKYPVVYERYRFELDIREDF